MDGNALISTVELEAAVQQTRKEKFDAKDENGDGFLIESEVGERFWSRVSLADSDADSQVTFDEFDAWVPTRGTDGARHGFERERRSQAVNAAFGTFGRKAFGRDRHH